MDTQPTRTQHHGRTSSDTEAGQRFLLVREAAELMRMDASTLYRHLRRGSFPAVKVGGRYLVPAAAVDELIDEAVATKQCVIVDQWARQWREQLAAEALARGLTPPSTTGAA